MEKWEDRKYLVFPCVCLVGGMEKREGEKLPMLLVPYQTLFSPTGSGILKFLGKISHLSAPSSLIIPSFDEKSNASSLPTAGSER